MVPLTRDSSTAMSTISVNDADFLWCINYLLKQNFWETKDKLVTVPCTASVIVCTQQVIVCYSLFCPSNVL